MHLPEQRVLPKRQPRYHAPEEEAGRARQQDGPVPVAQVRNVHAAEMDQSDALAPLAVCLMSDV